MKKQDPYCYPETSVLKNKFNIREVSLLEKAEADLSRAKMSILYESPVDKFDAQSFLRVHEFLFEEVYDWAGRLRTINISKPEEVLGGKSIWYEDALDLPESLDRACTAIVDTVWHIRDKRRFCAQLAHVFAPIWKVHPFRDGNGRASRMLMNYQLMAAGFLPVSIAKEERLEYFETLEAYAVDGDLTPFAEMVASLEERRLDEYLILEQQQGEIGHTL